MNRKGDGKKTTISIILNSITCGISIIVSLISTIIISRVMTVSDVGIATSFSSLKNILTIVCLVSLYTSINRMMLDIKNNKYEYIFSIYVFSSIACIALFIIYFIFRSNFNSLFGFNTFLMTLMFTMIFLINSCTLLVRTWIYENKYKLSFLYNILASPLAQIFSIILVCIMNKEKYIGRIIGIDIFNIIFGVGCGIYIFYKSNLKYNKKYVKQALSISLPMVPYLLSQVLLMSCDLLMIKNIIGNTEAGIYSMAYTIANILHTILIQLLLPWSPWVYRRLKENEIDSIKDNSKLLMLLAFYLCIGLFTVAPEMINLFLNKSYYASSLIVAPICVGVFFEVMYIFFYDVEYFYKKNKQIAMFSMIAAVLNIILNYILIKKVGYQAAAYTTIFSYLVLLILHYIGMRRVDKRKIYDVKYLFVLSIILIVLSLTYVLSNNNIFLRYSTLIIITIILLIRKRKVITNLIKQGLKKVKIFI